MELRLSKLKYHRDKEEIELNEAQVLMLVADLVQANLAQSGFSCEIKTV